MLRDLVDSDDDHITCIASCIAYVNREAAKIAAVTARDCDSAAMVRVTRTDRPSQSVCVTMAHDEPKWLREQ